MAATPAYSRLVARILPSGAGYLRRSVVTAPPRQPRRFGYMPRSAHAEGARSDEPARASRHPRIRASHETIAKSLVGDYRQEHLFTLRQSVAMYREYQRRIAACEEEMQWLMKGLETKADPAATLPPPKDSVKNAR